MAGISVLMDADNLRGQSIRVINPREAYALLTTAGIDITLPFPTNMVSTTSPQWQGNDRSKISQLAGEESVGAAYETVKGWIGGVDAIISSTMNKKSAAYGMLGALAMGKEQVLHQSRKALNPFKQMMFSGMDFRTFELEFEIIPKSHDEADQLRQAIREIQIHSVPEIKNADNAFMEYPDSWQVMLLPEIKYLPSFLPSVITNINIDYAGAAGKIIFKEDHAPMSVNLSLSFAETEIFTKLKAQAYYG